MPSNNIKSLLDSIISGSPDMSSNTGDYVPANQRPVTHDMNQTSFDASSFREKLSLNVLSDIISAMMHDETTDLNGMIDESIMKHIHNDYKGTCFGYLSKARDRLNSPILGDIVQEIEDKTTAAEQEINTTGVVNQDVENPEIATKDILNGVSNYEELRQKLKDEVSKKVVNDVSRVITKSNDAPVFDNIDKTLKKDDSVTGANDSDGMMTEPNATDASVTESVIMKMTSSIVTEYAINKQPISTDEGINRAIITYCIGEMDALFDYDRSRTIVRKYAK